MYSGMRVRKARPVSRGLTAIKGLQYLQSSAVDFDHPYIIIYNPYLNEQRTHHSAIDISPIKVGLIASGPSFKPLAWHDDSDDISMT